MAKGKARYGGSGRVTPKSDEVEETVDAADGPVAAHRSARYTPPSSRQREWVETPRWVPVLMWTFLALGVLMILLAYFGVMPGGEQAINYWIIGGLGCITVGFIVATQLR